MKQTNELDELMERYYVLASTKNIQNIARYAFEWKLLAEDAEKAGRPACAESWGKRAAFYASQAGGEYLRIIEGSFCELILSEPGEEVK